MSPPKNPTLGQVSKENDRHGSEGAISQVFHQKEDFLSHIFLVGKKDGGNKPVINLKNLNNFSYQHFKIEGLYCLNKSFYWQEGNYMWKISLKDAYFCVPLSKDPRKLMRFQKSLPQLWTRPSTKVFSKLLKVPISVLRRLMVWVVIKILDDLLRAYSQDETLQFIYFDTQIL